MSLLHLKLRAMTADKITNRDYEIFVLKVLFGFYGVTLAFGRHGLRGTYKNHIFETKEEAKAFVCKTLRKRLTAPKRIGCSYVLVEAKVSDAEILDAWVTPEQVERLTTKPSFPLPSHPILLTEIVDNLTGLPGVVYIQEAQSKGLT
jgi:hypothetical protein